MRSALFTWVILALAAPFGWAGDANHGTIPPAAAREFQVLAAQWGQGHRWADVTEKACELSTEVGLDVVAERSRFGDPYPHFKKSLVVFYLWRGELYSATAPEHGRLRIPVSDDKAAAIRNREIAAEIAAAEGAARDRLDEAAATGSLDRIRKVLRKNRRIARRLGSRLVARLEGDPAGQKARIEEWRKRSRRAVKGTRAADVRVEATTDWRDLEVEVGPGDLVCFVAEGHWKLGTHAGSCGAEGFPGDRYRSCSTVDELPHGCLLVRLGSTLFGAGQRSGWIRAKERNRLSARCNDETYRDNSGEITVHVLVVPAAN